MHANTFAGLSLVVLAGAAGIPARAADGAPASESAPRLYTNADLAKFGPPVPATAPRRETATVDDAQAWAFVQAALDREAVRLEAERRHAMQMGAGAYTESSSGFPVDSGYLPGYYGGYYGNPFVDDRFRFDDGFRFGDRARSNHGFTENLIPRGHHGRYTFLKGADVVPRAKGARIRPRRPGRPCEPPRVRRPRGRALRRSPLEKERPGGCPWPSMVSPQVLRP
jgi:hypothetical protein